MRRLLLLLLVACNVDPGTQKSIAAANLLSREYRNQELQAAAAGHDCGVLLIESESRLDTTAVESIHYGTGAYGALGGAEQFAEDRRFRAVVYRDRSGIVRTYGATTLDEARSMPRCR